MDRCLKPPGFVPIRQLQSGVLKSTTLYHAAFAGSATTAKALPKAPEMSHER